MDTKETPVRSSFLGFIKSGDCPGCGTRLSKNLGLAEVLCSNCGDYALFGDKTLRPMEPSRAAPVPVFAAPTPWADMQAPAFGALLHPLAALDDLLRTKPEDVRLLEAAWPEGCCVCGGPAARTETIAQHVSFAPPNGGAPRRQKEATVVAKGIPHCAEHAEGARFERVISFGDANRMALGLFFKSYAYQIRFRKLNPWKWRG